MEGGREGKEKAEGKEKRKQKGKGKGKENGKGKGKETEKGKESWKEDSLRNVACARTHAGTLR